MPSTIGKCKLFRIKHTTLLEGETFLRNKHEIVFFEIKCTFFGRKENTINDIASLSTPSPVRTDVLGRQVNASAIVRDMIRQSRWLRRI